MEQPTLSTYTESFNEVRVLILIETKPFSDKYLQMEFTKEQFKEISKCIQNTWLRRIENLKDDRIIVKCKEREIPVQIDGMASWYK